MPKTQIEVAGVSAISKCCLHYLDRLNTWPAVTSVIHLIPTVACIMGVMPVPPAIIPTCFTVMVFPGNLKVPRPRYSLTPKGPWCLKKHIGNNKLNGSFGWAKWFHMINYHPFVFKQNQDNTPEGDMTCVCGSMSQNHRASDPWCLSSHQVFYLAMTEQQSSQTAENGLQKICQAFCPKTIPSFHLSTIQQKVA